MASREERARQFLPFDALKGFKKAIKEREKIVVLKKDLSSDMEEFLSYKLNQLRQGIIVKCIYYENNEYIVLEGYVSKVDFVYRFVDIVEKRIYFDDIYDVSSNDINDIEYEF